MRNDTVAFTYLIGWSYNNKWYYGVRYASGCSPEDMWVTYFTSSKYVQHYRELHGEPDVIQIRKTFDDPNKARLYEQKLLKRMKVVERTDFLNMSDHVSCDPYSISGDKHWMKTEYHRKRQSDNMKGENNPMYGKKHRDETRIKMSKNKKPQNGKYNPNSKKIIIDNILYDTIMDACNILNMSYYKVKKRGIISE